MGWERWRRVPEPGACDFCLMLATRGAVYASQSTAGKDNDYHAHCHCDQESEGNFDARTDVRISLSDARNEVEFYHERSGYSYSYDLSRFRNAGVTDVPGVPEWELGLKATAEEVALRSATIERKLTELLASEQTPWTRARIARLMKEDDLLARRSVARPPKTTPTFRRGPLAEAKSPKAAKPPKPPTTAAPPKPSARVGTPGDLFTVQDRVSVGRDVKLTPGELPAFNPANPLEFYGDRLQVTGRSLMTDRDLAELESLPQHVHETLRTYFLEREGGGFYIGDATGIPELDDLGHLAGVRPRGWPEGSTWDSVGGVHAGRQRVVAVANGGPGHGSVSAVLHESSHALDSALGRAGFDDILREAVERKAGPSVPYYTPAGNPTGWVSETWAESLAAYFKAAKTGAGAAQQIAKTTGMPLRTAETLRDYFDGRFVRSE